MTAFELRAFHGPRRPFIDTGGTRPGARHTDQARLSGRRVLTRSRRLS